MKETPPPLPGAMTPPGSTTPPPGSTTPPPGSTTPPPGSTTPPPGGNAATTLSFWSEPRKWMRDYIKELFQQDGLVKLLGNLAFLWYFISILVVAFSSSHPESDGFRSFMTLSITAIGSTLATFMGMVIGVYAQPKEKAITLTPWQYAAAYWYICSLVLALLLWAIVGNVNYDPVLKSLAKSLIGLLGGGLAVVLNVQSTPDTLNPTK